MKEEKKSFRIGELAQAIGVEKFVIRFWEKEFNIQGDRSEGGQRFYTTRNLTQFQTIKSLLYEEKFTISGAKKYLEENKNTIGVRKPSAEVMPVINKKQQQILASIKKSLVSLKEMI